MNLHELYSPCVSRPWWNPAASARVPETTDMVVLVTQLVGHIAILSHDCFMVVHDCANVAANLSISDHTPVVHGAWAAVPTLNRASPFFLPGRMLHKMLTLVRWIVGAMGSEWTQAHFNQSGDVSKDEFGILPTPNFVSEGGQQIPLGYLELPAPDTGLRTLVPLSGFLRPEVRFSILRQHLGHRELLMVLRDGQLVLDRGLYLTTTAENNLVTAVSGWTGNVMDSFAIAPARSAYWNEQWLSRAINNPVIGDHVREEIEARKRPDYFHIILAIKQMIPEDEWPCIADSELFIATPQRGIESELVELELLESLAEEAAAGDQHAQRLIADIEDECNRIVSPAALDSVESDQPSSSGDDTSQPEPLSIADIVAAKRAWMQRVIDEQLLIHAEAVERAENRRRIDADRVAGDASDSSSSASTASTAAKPSPSVLAPPSAASSASSSQSVSAGADSVFAGLSSVGSSSLASAAAAASAKNGSAYSWTSVFKTLESMREPGRVKYKTITSAALRFLHTLRPVSVNRSGGSHTVFHFASGKPVTLVQPHGGDGSVSRHAATRLYDVLREAALQQLSPTEALPAASSRRLVALTDAAF